MLKLFIRIIFALVSQLTWTIVRRLFGLCQFVLWNINGTSARIERNFKESSYKGSVQLMNIIARYKYDLMGQPSGPHLFITCHERFVDPEYVLEDDHISLFNVYKDKAVWVQVEKGTDLSRCDYAAFIYLAQFKLAKKLIIMPIHIFHDLGQKVGKPKSKLIFLTNTARCGSTLLTRVFAEIKTCLSYSEPYSLNAIALLRGVVSDEERERIFTHCINLLCKPLHSKNIEAYILKPTQPTMVELPHIWKLFPHSHNLFLYREGLAVARSVAKCADGVLSIAILQVVGRWSGAITKKLVEGMGLHSENFQIKLESDLHWGTIMWAAAIRQYLDFRKQGINIVAVRFEDLLKDSKCAFRKIFEYCGLPFDAKALEVGMSKDSQRGSPISHECLKYYKPDEYTGKVKVLAERICDQFDVPRFGEEFRAPETITLMD